MFGGDSVGKISPSYKAEKSALPASNSKSFWEIP